MELKEFSPFLKKNNPSYPREIWEFRTLYQKTYYRLFAFWDKNSTTETVVISTHGIIKKTDKTPKSEIERAEQLRQKYLNNKKKKS